MQLKLLIMLAISLKDITVLLYVLSIQNSMTISSYSQLISFSHTEKSFHLISSNFLTMKCEHEPTACFAFQQSGTIAELTVPLSKAKLSILYTRAHHVSSSQGLHLSNCPFSLAATISPSLLDIAHLSITPF